MHLIVFHADKVAVPAPAEGDSCIGYIMNGVMVDGDARHIASTDGHTAPVFIAYIIEFRLFYGLARAYFAEISGLIGQMGFQSFRRERAANVAVHGDIGEGAVGGSATTTCNNIIQTRAAKVLKAAAVEATIFCVTQFHGSIGTSQPSLVVQFMIVGTVNLRTQFIGLHQIHACLQGHMSFLRGTHPCGMREPDAFHRDIAYRMLGSSDEFHQGFQHRHYRLVDVLACPRHVIHFVLANVVIPFSRFIQQFLGIGHIERRGMFRVRRHR